MPLWRRTNQNQVYRKRDLDGPIRFLDLHIPLNPPSLEPWQRLSASFIKNSIRRDESKAHPFELFNHHPIMLCKINRIITVLFTGFRFMLLIFKITYTFETMIYSFVPWI